MAHETDGGHGGGEVRDERPDLPAQLESLFHMVWQCEEGWRLDDRIDLALRREEAVARTTRARRPR